MTESDQNSGGPEHGGVPEHSGGIVRWLFNPTQKRFMLPATGVWILVLDWLLFSSNVLSAWLVTPAAIVVGFALGGAGTYLLQKRRANDAPWRAILKAVLAGIVVGIPWPIGGTLVGGWVLMSSGLGDVRKEF